MTTPANTKVDARGRFVPVELIKPIDLARDSLVNELIDEARLVHSALRAFKARALRDLGAFVQLSAEQYQVELGGEKGNLTLHSFDGKLRILRQVADRIVFDERLKVAKALVDECVRDWSSDSRPEVRALIEHAFQADREGKVSTERVLGLRKLAIEDERWARAMRAVSDSVTIASTATYVRFYERDESGRWWPLSLDIATVPAADTGARIVGGGE